MSNKLSEKLRMQLATLALKFSYAYGEEWYSSAQQLEEVLKQKGINDIKVYYEYKMPDGKTPQEYMPKLALYMFYVDFDLYNNADDRFAYVDPEWCFQTNFRKLVPNEADRLLIIEEIRENRDIYDAKLTEDYKKLIELNPELSRLAGKQDKRADILWGAVFGYRPEDIEIYVDLKKYMAVSKALEKYADSWKKYGLPGMGIQEPKIVEKIIAALEQKSHHVIEQGQRDEISKR